MPPSNSDWDSPLRSEPVCQHLPTPGLLPQTTRPGQFDRRVGGGAKEDSPSRRSQVPLAACMVPFSGGYRCSMWLWFSVEMVQVHTNKIKYLKLIIFDKQIKTFH